MLRRSGATEKRLLPWCEDLFGTTLRMPARPSTTASGCKILASQDKIKDRLANSRLCRPPELVSSRLGRALLRRRRTPADDGPARTHLGLLEPVDS